MNFDNLGIFKVHLIFSATNKLSRLCSMVSNRLDNGSTINHRVGFMPCRTNVVYCVPLSCRRVYVGQTGRCVNIRLREHQSSLQGRPLTHLTMQCAECRCEAKFAATEILFKHRDRTTREFAEAFHINTRASSCIIRPSLAIYAKEGTLLDERR